MTTEATPRFPGADDIAKMSVNERDRIALDAIQRANDALETALTAMPNSISSVFDTDDAKRLHIIRRDLELLLMAQSEVTT